MPRRCGIRSRFSVASAIRSARLIQRVGEAIDAKALANHCHHAGFNPGKLKKQDFLRSGAMSPR